jgi:hypothetical protein
VPTLDLPLISILVFGSRNSEVFPVLYLGGMGQIATVKWLNANATNKVFWRNILGKIAKLWKKAEEQNCLLRNPLG